MARLAISLLLTLTVTLSATAADWPQWLGPQRDSIWPETGILDTFPEKGPTKKWSIAIQGGYAGPAVAAGKVYVADYVRTAGDPTPNPAGKNKLQGHERIQCVDANDGKRIWKFEYDCPYEISYPAGPRCTPTVEGNLVYMQGAMGHLHCLDATTGNVKWKKDFCKDYSAEVPLWGFSGHPVIHKDLVICLVGGKKALLVAFDKTSGQEKWHSQEAKDPGYCTPALVVCQGQSQLLFWHPTALVSLNPDSGEKNWEFPLKPNYGMSIMSPRKDGNFIFAGGIGIAALTLKADLATNKPVEHLRGTRLTAVYPVNMTPFLEDGILYGVCQPGALRAVDLESGKRLWSTMLPVTGKDGPEMQIASGTAFIVKNGKRFFLFAETGHLIIATMDAQGYNEISRCKLMEPTGDAFGRKVVWSHPAFAQKCIFARNDSELVCYSLAKE